ncbi:hypothetical protein NLM27_05485 [Bradyrhizobium sp. CCGB12]|uniref:hypothetical protein n=1 Tax=Bradyrhizobium sp. CCGB12 TaxID=2949632 RepID=UPI0020B361D5|nr:hypothetical protein [Bradyrhizobium sp. CCGB12]MCP3388230.1 hypothetical protein [Bradyrhizobium sp. CCGB12]
MTGGVESEGTNSAKMYTTRLEGGLVPEYIVGMDRADIAKRYRYQAEELRAKADIMADADTRDHYVKVAEAYEQLAESEEIVSLRPTAPPGTEA